MDKSAVLKVKNLSKHFGSTRAVDGVSFEVNQGEIFGFLGPNGAGKTTTIRCILDFLRPNSGEIEIFGYNSSKSNFNFSRRQIGYLIQGGNLIEHWTGSDHFSYIQGLCGISQNLNQLIKKFSFDAKPRVKNLSTGNRQKLGLILTFMNNPEFIILDEPTASLDPILQEELYSLMRQFVGGGGTVLMSSHNLPEVEKVCSKVAMIKSGKIITVQKISELEGRKLHSVIVTFRDKVSKNDLQDDNIVVNSEFERGFELTIRHEIDAFIKKIAKYNIENLQITQANLEEIFMEFYK